ncbi:MFS transporter [Tritonibacter mobilis]|uniref:MFS transporter n=1 Tax=Tritonibacter mobilis TaxID=379347 RepID=UPI0014455C59
MTTSTSTSKLSYMLFTFLSSLNIGGYLVLTSWLAVSATGDAQIVATLFLASLVCGMFFSNIAGVYTRTTHIRFTLVLANTVRLLGALFLVLSVYFDKNLYLSLYAVTLLNVLGNSFIMIASSVSFQEIFHKEERSRRVAEVSLLRQVGIASGTGLTGVVLAWTGSLSATIFLALVTLFQTPLMIFFSPYKKAITSSNVISTESNLSRWLSGFSYALVNRDLAIAMIILSATFSVAQLTNVMVPVFVLSDLSSGANTYATLEMAWAIGGSLALIVARRIKETSNRLALMFMAAIGLTMVIFSVNRSIPISFVIYFFMGGLFCIVRFISDSRIMIDADIEYVGRVRAANLLLTNSIGVLIFGLPWIVDTSSVSTIYLIWGVVLFVLSATSFFLLNSNSRSAIGRS